MQRLIVDGYNVLHAHPRYEILADRDLDSARAKLVEDVASFAVGRFRATVVFDAAANAASTGEPHHVANVAVVFSPAGMDADSVIESLAYRARERGESAVVVTSDGETQRLVAALGSARMSSPEFIAELDASAEDLTAHSSAGSTRGRVEERIPSDVREKLFRWARGR